MIYFLTKRTDHDPLIYKTPKIKVLGTLDKLKEIMLNTELEWDVEANSKKYWQTTLLLFQLGNKANQIVIDMTEPEALAGWNKEVVDTYNQCLRPDHVFYGHNLKYDINTCVPYGFKIPTIYDSLLSEQRINLGSGLFNNLKDSFERRLQKFFPEDKNTRKDFMKMNKFSRLKLKHLTYAAGDVGCVIDIANVQKDILIKTKQAWFVKNVEFPLVKVLSEMELEGLHLDQNIWTSLIQTKKKDRFSLELRMDNIIATLGKGNMYLTGGKYSTIRKKAAVSQTSLFDTTVLEVENINKHNVNYGSSDEVGKIIDKLGLPRPTKVEKKVEKNSLAEDAIHTYLLRYADTPIRELLEKFLEYSKLSKFINTYGEKFLKSIIFKKGKYQVGYLNPITNKVHTQFKQCFTSTGRLSSGEDKNSKTDDQTDRELQLLKMGVFNIQNIPADKPIRGAFGLTPQEIFDYFRFTTCDLSQAELIIMAALANDIHLYNIGADKMVDGKLVEGDLHSYIATKCWKAVFTFREAIYKEYADKIKELEELGLKSVLNVKETNRAKELESYLATFHIDKTSFFTIRDTKNNSYLLSEDFTINKKQNKQLRTDFKSYTFGVLYGMRAKTGGETLNILAKEAQVMIDVILSEFPVTVKMLDQAELQAFRYGYVVFNNRSNNRRIFKPVIDILKTIDTSKYNDSTIITYVKDQLGFSSVSDITGEARNCKIQGTQADMMKEILVEIHKHPDYIPSKAKLLLSVHDEAGAKHQGEAFGQTIEDIMNMVPNKYLELYSSTIKMRCERNTTTSWTK